MLFLPCPVVRRVRFGRDGGRGAAGAAGVAAEERQAAGRRGPVRAGHRGDGEDPARAARWCSARWSAVAQAQVKRGRAGPCEGKPGASRDAGAAGGAAGIEAGPGVIGRIAGNARLDGRFAKGERERLLAAAFMIRVIVLMTLMPEARIEDVIIALAGTWRWSRGRGRGGRRRRGRPGTGGRARSGALEELRDIVLGSAWREHRGPGCPGAVTIGRSRPLKAGSLDGTLVRMPDTPANRAVSGPSGRETTPGRGRAPGPFR